MPRSPGGLADADRRAVAGINRLLRGESNEYLSLYGTVYRRVWHDGTEYFEQRHADGAFHSNEITPSLQAAFDRIAAADADDLAESFREKGLRPPWESDRPN